MAGLARDKYMPLVRRESGDRSYPIWLLINPKYPAVYNDIWGHILDEIQDKVYREIRSRIDTSNIYVRCAVNDCGIVPDTLNWWGNEVAEEIKVLREIIMVYQPTILVSFGGFPYEFARRVFEIMPIKGPKYWSASVLRDEFEKSMTSFNMEKTNIIPLLRRANPSNEYFHYVGTRISERIIQNKDSLNIWIK